jgi:hypothetical protein
VDFLRRSSFDESVLLDAMVIRHVFQAVHWRSLESCPFLSEYWSNPHPPLLQREFQPFLDPHHLPHVQRLVQLILLSAEIEIEIPTVACRCRIPLSLRLYHVLRTFPTVLVRYLLCQLTHLLEHE